MADVSLFVYADDGDGTPLSEMPYLGYAPQATNHFLDNLAPVTQTISGLTGIHTVWCEGTGTVTLSGGLTGVVSEGNPVTGNPAGADVICTVAGSPDFVQVEDNAAPTAMIPTESVAVTRDADGYSFDSANWSDTEGSVYLEADVTGTALLVDGLLDIANGFVGLKDGTNAVRAASLVEGLCQIGWVYSPTGMRLCVDGTWTQTVPYDGGMLQGIFDLYRSAAVVGGMRNIQGIAKANEQWVTDKMPVPADYGDDFVMVVQTTAPGETFTLPCGNAGAYNAVIDWGDGTSDSSITSYNDADLAHTYSDAGKHTMRVSGTLPWIYFNNGGHKAKVIAVLNGGSIGSLSAQSMFFGCPNLVVSDLSGFDTAAVTSMYDMFRDCSALTSLDVSSFDTAAVTSTFRMFRSCSSLTSLDLSNFDTAAVTDMGQMFYGCSALTSLDVSSFDTAAVTNMLQMFNICSSLTSLDVSSFDTAAVTNMSSMFSGCSALTALDLSSFDTAAVTNMAGMFNICSALTSLDVSGFDTAAVTDMSSMFSICSSLTAVNLPDLVGGAVKDMGSIFSTCSSLVSIDLSGFNAAVGNLSLMFFRCADLTSVDLSGLDAATTTKMDGLFRECTSLVSAELSGLDTGAVTDMSQIFRACPSLTYAGMSGVDTAAVTNMNGMFYACASLISLDLSDLRTDAVTDMSSMFHGCSKVPTASMDGFLNALYDSRLATAWATPVVDISPCNAPSGTYQDATPPTTGEEFRYKLENDPDGESFHQWAITV